MSFTPKQNSLKSPLFIYEHGLENSSDTQSVLDRWKEKEVVLPSLCSVVKKYFCFQPTNVASERIGSLISQILTRRRNNISNEIVKKFIVLTKNVYIW